MPSLWAYFIYRIVLNPIFHILYWVTSIILYIFLTPVFIILTFYKNKYKNSIPARFFLKNNINFKGNVWIHACSLGEINSIEFIVENIQEAIILTTITQTGYNRAKELFKNKANIKIRFLPFEIFLPFLMPKTLKKLIVVEAELWPMLFFSAKRVGAQTMLINSRISNKSYPRYKKVLILYKNIFKNIDKILCQRSEDKFKLEYLGGKDVEVFGNIKIFNKPTITNEFKKFSGTTIIAASTHEGEEGMIIDSCKEILKNDESRLIIAPRHPERFNKVWIHMQNYGFQNGRFSLHGLNYKYKIILMDKIGELINLYNIASLVILGGSFVNNVGGHNPIECAALNKKLITGPYIYNQYALFESISGYTMLNGSELKANMQNIEKLPNSYIKNLDYKIEALLKYIKI